MLFSLNDLLECWNLTWCLCILQKRPGLHAHEDHQPGWTFHIGTVLPALYQHSPYDPPLFHLQAAHQRGRTHVITAPRQSSRAIVMSPLVANFFVIMKYLSTCILVPQTSTKFPPPSHPLSGRHNCTSQPTAPGLPSFLPSSKCEYHVTISQCVSVSGFLYRFIIFHLSVTCIISIIKSLWTCAHFDSIGYAFSWPLFKFGGKFLWLTYLKMLNFSKTELQCMLTLGYHTSMLILRLKSSLYIEIQNIAFLLTSVVSVSTCHSPRIWLSEDSRTVLFDCLITNVFFLAVCAFLFITEACVSK